MCHRDPTRGRAKKTPALRRILEDVAKLCSELGRRAVIVWLSSGGFGESGVVEFGELVEVFSFFALGGVLQ
jgi:hypothetical protein